MVTKSNPALQQLAKVQIQELEASTQVRIDETYANLEVRLARLSPEMRALMEPSMRALADQAAQAQRQITATGVYRIRQQAGI